MHITRAARFQSQNRRKRNNRDAKLQANGTEWAKIENLKWQMYYQSLYEQKLIATGITPEQARECWMTLIGKNYL